MKIVLQIYHFSPAEFVVTFAYHKSTKNWELFNLGVEPVGLHELFLHSPWRGAQELEPKQGGTTNIPINNFNYQYILQKTEIEKTIQIAFIF